MDFVWGVLCFLWMVENASALSFSFYEKSLVLNETL